MCLFCKIAKKEIPAQIVFEDERVVAFKDINPQAPTHLLVIPKQHLPGVHEATAQDKALLGEVLYTARNVAESAGLAASGYRLVINQGEHAGQSVHHLHVHVLGGRSLAWPPG